MALQTFSEILVQSVTDGPVLTAAARASCIPTANRIVLPSAYFQIGKRIGIKMSGRISSVITTPGTARFDVDLGPAGTIIVFDSLAILLDTVAGHTNVKWELELELVCRAVGATTLTTFFPAVARFISEDILGVPASAPKGVLAAMLPWNTAPVIGSGCDNNALNILDVFFTQTAATGSLTVHDYCVGAYN